MVLALRRSVVLLALVGLTGCGALGENAAKPEAAITQEELAMMVVPENDLGVDISGLAENHAASGRETAREAADGTIDPEDTARSIRRQGWVAGSVATFSNSTAPGAMQARGPALVTTSVDLFDSESAARAIVLKEARDFERFKGHKVGRAKLQGVAVFDASVGDEGSLISFNARVGRKSFFVTGVLFRHGRIVGAAVVSRPDPVVMRAAVLRIARKLDDRIGRVLAGKRLGQDSDALLKKNLAIMVVPQEDFGGLPIGLRVTSDSGRANNAEAAKGTLNPRDSGASLTAAGRLDGYQLSYEDPTLAALRSGKGVFAMSTWVDLLRDERSASKYLREVTGYWPRAVGKPQPGVHVDTVSTFNVQMVGESHGLRVAMRFERDGGARVYRTQVIFRRGRVVAAALIVSADKSDRSEDAKRLAGILDSRISTALNGKLNAEPVPIPKHGVPVDADVKPTQPPPGQGGVASAALQPADLPAGIAVAKEGYVRTEPPRITYTRTFLPGQVPIGNSHVVELDTYVNVFESDAPATFAYSVSAQALGTDASAREFAANFAATAGLQIKNLHQRKLTLPHGDVGVLSSFDTSAGHLEYFFALMRRGRAYASIDAVGPAERFDYHDLLPVLDKARARLDSL